MKVDMEAMKEQMATMMEAMMSMKKIMEANAVAIAATSAVAKVNPMPPSGLNQMNHPTSTMVGKDLGSTGGPYYVQIQNKHAFPPYGLPPNLHHPMWRTLPMRMSITPLLYSLRANNLNLIMHISFKEYAQRWRDLAAQVVPSMTEKEMITKIVDTLPMFYYEKMVGYAPSSFVDLVFAGKRVKAGLKRGKFDHPALMNEKIGANEEDENEEGTHVVTAIPIRPSFPPTQQCHYSANNNPSPYPSPSYPQRPSLN
ncbi:hypothetical protein GmHk_05G012897 [Glycine max]|nr:hypothetical protein GmHk_05G012897 [Glycine max]